MSSSKYSRSKNWNTFIPSEILDTVRELEEDALGDQEHAEEVPQSEVNMLVPNRSSGPASRLRRLSTLLQISSLRIDSKTHKDNTLRKPLSRKQIAGHYEQPPTHLPSSTAVPTFHDPTPSYTMPPPPSMNRSHQAGSPPPELRLPQPDRHTYPQPGPRQNSLLPPSPMDSGHARVVSSPVNGRPISYYAESEAGSTATSKLRRKSWVPGVMGGNKKSRNASRDHDNAPSAWCNAGEGKIDYGLSMLLQGEMIPELWNDYADTYVYLFPRESNHGPSFKVPSKILGSSQPLLSLLYGHQSSGRAGYHRGSLSAEDSMRNLSIGNVHTPPYTPSYHGTSEGSGESLRSLDDSPPSTENHLYFPVNVHSQGDEVQALVDIRNLFAFFMGQPLVATRQNPSQFRIFLSISTMLKTFQFSNFDGSTFGESAVTSFEQYVEEMQLADVRESREATIEGLILGEAMRSVNLYNEAFAHAVGKYSAVKGFGHALFDEISSVTRTRLENSARQLTSRIQAAEECLTDLEFPSLFSGIANSTSLEESKMVRFPKWKMSCLSFRKHVLSFYKGVHGQWPPKASSKKNSFNVSGLNRLVLKGLYHDFCDLYDYLVDRTALTTRAYDASDDQESFNVTPAAAALRKVLGEFDRSSPPVKPPIPFDVPLIPTIASIDPYFPLMSPKDQNRAITRRLKKNESPLILTKSHNLEANVKTDFMESFIKFEEQEASGKNVQELAEMRLGHWVLLYAVIQSLPLLAEDAPGLHFTNGVEYFLCQPTMGKLPWVEDAPAVSMGWYEVSGGGGVVSLPDDVVSNGVEATYRRSHCWNMGSQWIGQDPEPFYDDSMRAPMMSPLAPPLGFADYPDGEVGLRQSARPRERAGSPSRPGSSSHSHHRSGSRQSSGQTWTNKRESIALGLERLPMPGTVGSPTNSRPGTRSGSPATMYSTGLRPGSSRGDTPASFVNTGHTFDDILGPVDPKQDKKEGKKLKKFFGGGDGAVE